MWMHSQDTEWEVSIGSTFSEAKWQHLPNHKAYTSFTWQSHVPDFTLRHIYTSAREMYEGVTAVMIPIQKTYAVGYYSVIKRKSYHL